MLGLEATPSGCQENQQASATVAWQASYSATTSTNQCVHQICGSVFSVIASACSGRA
jgi:hypothetical protein